MQAPYSQQSRPGPSTAGNSGKSSSGGGAAAAGKKAAKDKDREKDKENSGGGSDTTSKDDKEGSKKRSSKACDPCRKAKCKCTRTAGDDGSEDGPCQNCTTNNLECTFLGASKKRGPPKGYIEAIENRMHRMEALLGGLLNNDDPRAQALLEELVGDIEARELLSKDLQTAAATGRDNAPVLKSWQRVKREDDVSGSGSPGSVTSSLSTKDKAPITQRGFDLSGISASAPASGSVARRDTNSGLVSTFLNTPSSGFAGLSAGQQQQHPSWFSEEDLLLGGDNRLGLVDSGVSGMDSDMSNGGNTGLSGSYTSITGNSYSGQAGHAFSVSPRNQRRRLDTINDDTASNGPGGNAKPANTLFAIQNRARDRDGNSVAAPATIMHTGSAYYRVSSETPGRSSKSPAPAFSAANRQSPDVMGLGDAGGSYSSPKTSPAIKAAVAAAEVAAATGSADVKTEGELDEGAPLEQPLSELADVVGQLSLDENKEVRYHGRSSGLYLISKSARYQDFFWRFPKAGIWPPTEEAESSLTPNASEYSSNSDQAQQRARQRDALMAGSAGIDDYNRTKTEEEIITRTNARDVLPDKRTSDHLLELYWIYVHPHLPLLYRSLFVRQYRNTVHGSDSHGQPGPAQAHGGKVPTLLLLAVYALASRYSNASDNVPSGSSETSSSSGAAKSPPQEGRYWKAGDVYAEKARQILFEDFGSSRLTTCQALLLLSYREVGCGRMAQSWLYVGMAIRMSQDLGLFRDVDKWFLPVNAFAYEEKQTRKRVWWSCVIMDKYISAYIGRPMMIFERDYDVAFPSADEPDEHDIWRPIRPDGTDWASPPHQLSGNTASNSSSDPSFDQIREYPQGIKSNSISCANHSASLAVLFSRIIASLYAIRTRVLGQNSETLLAHLDQALANWFLKLPPHLQYNSAGKHVPTPHVLVLHCKFYAALILLHRPFIPAQGSTKSTTPFPSHSICTTAAAAISNIVTLYSKTYSLRQSIPFLVYYVFSAGIMHVYNSTYDAALAPAAKVHLVKCMQALKEMDVTWGSASRQRELLMDLVDLRDVSANLDGEASGMMDDVVRGRKRGAENVDSAPGSGAGTPIAANSGTDTFRKVPPVSRSASFATTAAMRSESQKALRGGQGNVAAQRNNRRHNSISFAGLQGREKDGPDMRTASYGSVNAPNLRTSPDQYQHNQQGLSAGSALPAAFSSDFTFVSPSARTEPLPIPPSIFGSAQQQSNMSQQHSNPRAAPAVQSPLDILSPTFSFLQENTDSDYHQHSFNILGLAEETGNFDFTAGLDGSAHSNDNNVTQQSSGEQHPLGDQLQQGSSAGVNEGSAPQQGQPLAGTEFFFDPFWRSVYQQHDPSNQTFASPEQQSGGYLNNPQNSGSANIFDVLSAAEPPSEDWASFLAQANHGFGTASPSPMDSTAYNSNQQR